MDRPKNYYLKRRYDNKKYCLKILNCKCKPTRSELLYSALNDAFAFIVKQPYIECCILVNSRNATNDDLCKKVHYLMIGLAMRAEPAGSFGADPPVR
jgi:hypothetical protein